MKAIKVMSAVFLVAAMFTSCKKKNCDLTSGNMKGTYKVSSVMLKKTPSSAEVEILNNSLYFDPCERDNTFIFAILGVYEERDAGSTCSGNSSNEIVDVGAWTVNNGALSLNGIQINVTDFNCNSFTVTSNDEYTTGDVVKTTYKRQ